MATSDYYGQRARGVYGLPDADAEGEPEVEEVEEEEPKAETAASSGPRFRTSGGAIII
ncbi:hypothetical protein [Streptomyces fagopyri]|uniref:hypothetical protein n=1 Tax=Streptomyces fagopyri TaxID=2662397 RepID=UPI0012939BD0|nr:hypothetical protein [Streptomyces fagopyri]